MPRYIVIEENDDNPPKYIATIKAASPKAAAKRLKTYFRDEQEFDEEFFESLEFSAGGVYPVLCNEDWTFTFQPEVLVR